MAADSILLARKRRVAFFIAGMSAYLFCFSTWLLASTRDLVFTLSWLVASLETVVRSAFKLAIANLPTPHV